MKRIQGKPVARPYGPGYGKSFLQVEWDGLRYVTYRFYDVQSLSDNGSFRCKVQRLYEAGDFCEWPTCTLALPASKVGPGRIRVLNIKMEGVLVDTVLPVPCMG